MVETLQDDESKSTIRKQRRKGNSLHYVNALVLIYS